jgi:surface polysaccharide O-acyltransferase-like enzyme
MVSGAFIKSRWTAALVAVAIVFFIFGLLGKSYSNTALGIHVTFNTRDGPFFGLIFFVTGYLLSARKPDARWFGVGLATTAMGYLLQFYELHILSSQFNTSPIQDYVVGTYFVGVGVALIALSNFRVWHSDSVSRLATVSLGIYTAHLMFVIMLRPLHAISYWLDVLSIVIIFLFSALMALAFASNRATARLVS